MNVMLTSDQKIKLANTDDLYQVMKKILQRENRLGLYDVNNWVIGLNSDWVIEYIELISKGTDFTLKPVDVFSFAVTKKCTRIILAHNVIGKDLLPNKVDKTWTKQISTAGALLEITVVDHLIFNEDNYHNFL